MYQGYPSVCSKLSNFNFVKFLLGRYKKTVPTEGTKKGHAYARREKKSIFRKLRSKLEGSEKQEQRKTAQLE